MTDKYSRNLPTRPYSVIDAINRYAAATGSVRYAQASTDASYNGHFVSVYFNDFRGYWLAEYQWGERVVLARGTLSDCLRAAQAEYNQGARGSSVSARYPDPNKAISKEVPTESLEEFGAICAELGFTAEEDSMPWLNDMHKEVPEAFDYQSHGLAPAVDFLADSKSLEEYQAKLASHFAQRKARRTM